MVHRRYLEMFRLLFSSVPVIVTGGLIAIVILAFQIYPIEIISTMIFIRFIGIHVFFAIYILLGVWLGGLHQLLKICEKIEDTIMKK